MALQADYKDVLDVAKAVGGQVQSREEGGKLVLEGTVDYAWDRDRIWDQIKATHPQWQQQVMVTLTVKHNEPYGLYTVKAGDTLGKIAKDIYKDAKLYPRIFELNRDQLPNADTLKVGQKLKLPPKSIAHA